MLDAFREQARHRQRHNETKKKPTFDIVAPMTEEA
jgi:hypothetical protein